MASTGKERDGKLWVLDTETKGTGAHMVPLESLRRGSTRGDDLALIELGRPLRRAKVAEPAGPRRFRVLNVMTNEVVADGASARDTVDVLRCFRSVVDVLVYVWDTDRSRWRMLTLDEQRALWRHRDAAT